MTATIFIEFFFKDVGYLHGCTS